jgi:KipI family sensor histidine kinase inhibitor
LLVRFADTNLETAVARAQWLRQQLAKEDVPRLGERVLGAGNLLLRLVSDSAEDLDEVAARVRRCAASREDSAPATPLDAPAAAEAIRQEHRIAVRYGGDEGPDLGAVAQAAGLTPERVVELHSEAAYRVAFIGFSPGFPYLIGLPPELRLARRPVPRPAVRAGSVAIAGPFAGVYPSPTPAGWHVIGHTQARLFDFTASPPAWLAPGDRVRFAALP